MYAVLIDSISKKKGVFHIKFILNLFIEFISTVFTVFFYSDWSGIILDLLPGQQYICNIRESDWGFIFKINYNMYYFWKEDSSVFMLQHSFVLSGTPFTHTDYVMKYLLMTTKYNSPYYWELPYSQTFYIYLKNKAFITNYSDIKHGIHSIGF